MKKTLLLFLALIFSTLSVSAQLPTAPNQYVPQPGYTMGVSPNTQPFYTPSWIGAHAITASTTLTDSAATLQTIDATTGAVVVTLPPTQSVTGATGHPLCFKAINVDNLITLQAASGDTIDGAANITMTVLNQAISLESDGTRTWRLINNTTGGGGGAVSSVSNADGSVNVSPTTGAVDVSLPATAVTPGSYTSTNLTVDQKGRITAAANGTPGGVTSAVAGSGIAVSGPTGAVTITNDGVRSLSTANSANITVDNTDPHAPILNTGANVVTSTSGTGYQSIINRPDLYPNSRHKINLVLGGTPNSHFNIECTGDSTTCANQIPNPSGTPLSVDCDGGYPKRMIQALNTFGIPAAEGFNAFDNKDGADPRLTLGAGWSLLGTYGPGPPGDGFGIFNSSTTNNLSYAPGYVFDTIKIIYVTNTGWGLNSVNVDGGATLGTFDGNAAAGYATFTGTCPRGIHTLNVTADGVNQTVIIAIECYDSTTNSVLISNWGSSGSTIGGWVTGNYAGNLDCNHLMIAIANSMPGGGADCWINNTTINDAYFNTPPSTYQTNMNTFITNARAASAGKADVILGTGIPTAETILSTDGITTIYAGELIEYALIRNTIAPANNCAFFDLASRWVNFTTSNPYDYYNADGIHGSWLGYYDFGWSIATMLTPMPASTQFVVPGVTTVAGSAGNLYWSMPRTQPGDKRVVIKLEGYTAAGATVITFPTAFTNTPDMIFNNTSLSPTVSTTQISIPAATTVTATIIIEGI